MINIINEGPREITIQNVQYWSKHTKELASSQRRKALQFLEYDCIRYIGDDDEFNSKYTFIVLPLNMQDVCKEVIREQIVSFHKVPFPKNYNWSAYKIYKNGGGNFECNCQGWQTKAKRGELISDGANCSHVLALFYAFKIGKFNKSHGASEEHIKIDMLEEYDE